MRGTICHVEALRVNVCTRLEIQHLLLNFSFSLSLSLSLFGTRWLSDFIFKRKETSFDYQLIKAPLNIQGNVFLRR